MPQALVIGAGPAGLMAAQELAQAGHEVLLAEAKPSVGRKFLMAGKSGLNLTKEEDADTFLDAYDEAAEWLRPMLEEFGPENVQQWARDLGQTLFTGSTGRVFPEVMKASPLLRAWLHRLDALGVRREVNWQWVGWDGSVAKFGTPSGPQRIHPDVTVLALGGASWSRLGSDGAWAAHFDDAELAPFEPANAGLRVSWSAHMEPHYGRPLKGVEWSAGHARSRGEAVVSQRGLEGGGIYSICKSVRQGAALDLDLLPDHEVAHVARALSRNRGKASLSNHLRKALRLDATKIALLMEFGRPLPQESEALAHRIKRLRLRHNGLAPLDDAISTSGGVRRTALDDALMLRARPGVFCAGEMLDWEAPTGGYLLTACLATGRWAGRGAAAFLARSLCV